MKKVTINKDIMQEAFDYRARQSYWQEKVTNTYAEIGQKEAEIPSVNMTVVAVNKGRTRRLWQYAAAASVALLVLSIWVINNQRPQNIHINNDPVIADASVDVDKLLNNNVDHFQATIVRKGSSDTDNWQSDFQSAKYREVIRTLETVGKNRTVEQAYYLAQAYLKMNPKNTAKAQPLFKIVSEANSDYAQDALWSYALICVMHKQNDTAKTALDKVIKESPIYSNQASALRDSLK